MGILEAMFTSILIHARGIGEVEVKNTSIDILPLFLFIN